MKLKLTGLLLLSQAANALTIDRTNYNQYLCDERDFGTPGVIYELTPSAAVSASAQSILGVHSQYCKAKSMYEEALKKEQQERRPDTMECGWIGGRRENTVMPTPTQCKEQQGILYAKACENLKEQKQKSSKAWSNVMPRLNSCVNK